MFIECIDMPGALLSIKKRNLGTNYPKMQRFCVAVGDLERIWGELTWLTSVEMPSLKGRLGQPGPCISHLFVHLC